MGHHNGLGLCLFFIGHRYASTWKDFFLFYSETKADVHVYFLIKPPHNSAFKKIQRRLCLMENFHLIIYWHSKTLENKTHIATFKLSSLFYVREASEVIDPAHWCHLKFGNITNSSLSHFHTVSSLPPWPSVEPRNTPGLSEPLPWPFQRSPRSPLAELWTHHHE